MIKIGIVGAGSFGRAFVPLFKAHPAVSAVALADVLPERLAAVAAEFGISETYASHAAMCRSDMDAVAIFSQRHLHGPQCIEALRHGKHVYCAVPAASTLEEIEALVRAVEETGLIYMSGETSSTSMLVSVTGATLVQVSCLGWVDRAEDDVFGRGKNLWDNPFSNQTALFRTSDGGMFRVNEFRRVGHGAGNCVRMSLYGTEGCFEQQGNAHFWTTLDRQSQDINDLMNCDTGQVPLPHKPTGGEQEDFFSGVSPLHPLERLPREFIGLPNGHYGSHQFLVDDFVRALTQDKLPPNHVWAAARYLAPGLVAHQSAKMEGELLKIPDFGEPPPGRQMIS
jgi:predicted dehydrogenase